MAVSEIQGVGIAVPQEYFMLVMLIASGTTPLIRWIKKQSSKCSHPMGPHLSLYSHAQKNDDWRECKDIPRQLQMHERRGETDYGV